MGGESLLSHRKPHLSKKSIGDDIHLYLFHCLGHSGRTAEASLRHLLSAEEIARSHIFLHEADRRQFVVARGMVRTLLSRYQPEIAASSWNIHLTKYGRPQIGGDSNLNFNVSHSHGVIAIAIGPYVNIGIDIERHRHHNTIEGIASEFLTNSERAEVSTLLPYLRKRRLYDYWCLKEAYVKACGKGLAIPLKQIEFDLSGEDSISYSFKEYPEIPSSNWCFWSFSLPSNTSLALAVAEPHERASIKVYRGMPFISSHESPLMCRISTAK